MGNPDQGTPARIVDKLVEAARNPRNHRYSASAGIPNLRLAICKWYARRYGVELNPENEAIATMGAKEGISHLVLSMIGPGDTVIFSSRMIPGNELAIGQNIDNLFRAGVKVHYQAPPMVHISGHASAGEITALVRMTSPRNFVPVHGDYRNLVACAAVAKEGGVENEDIHILDPGQVLELDPSGARIEGSVPSGRMLVDGSMIGSLGDPILKDRRRMAREGVVVVAVSLPSRGQEMAEPVVSSRGVIVGPHGEELDREAAGAARRVLKTWRKEKTSIDVLEENLRVAVRGVYRKALDKKPTVLPVIIED